MANKTLLCCAALCLFCSFAQAQEVDTTGFNALEYSMQKRWRPSNSEFRGDRFSDNLTLSLGGGVEQLLERSTSSYSLGPLFRASLGKDLNITNNLFVGVSAGMFRRNRDGAKVLRGGLELGHSFDIASYFWGYDPDRKLGLGTVEALGINLSRASGQYRFSASVSLGLRLKAMVAKDFEFFFQPDVSFYTDGIDCSSAANWQKFDFGYGFSFGALLHLNRYRAVPFQVRNPTEWLIDGGYFLFSGGCNFQISSLTLDRPGLFPSARETVQLTYGRVVEGPLAVELAFFYSRDVWKQFSEGRNMPCYYVGFRPQMAFDPLWWAGIDWFSMPLVLGPEVGLMAKIDDGYSVIRSYMGLSVALRPDFLVHRHLSLFLEPRFSMVPYTWTPRTNSTLVTGSRNYYDMLLSLSLGMRVPF